MKRIIFGQGMRRSEIGERLDNNTYQARMCLAQLYMFLHDNCRNHWINELWNKFASIPHLKDSNRWPDKEDRDATNLNPSVEELDRIIKEYFNWIATQIATNQKIAPAQVKEKVTEFGL